MSQDYNYDDQGQFFPYFILTITGLVTVPLTYSLVRPSKDPENTAPRIRSDFKPEHADLIDKERRKQRRRELKLKRIITAGLGWLVMAWMVYLMVVTARITPKIWDPYDVLGVSRSADERQIKSHYRKLSVQFHPDKVRPDAAKNETEQFINDRWVEITKAFKTLTDEEIRQNYIQYGHPDGKQSFSIGIALPKLLISEGNGKYVLLVYGILLGVILPYLVGKWWYGSQRVTKEKVLVSSAANLFREYRQNVDQAETIAILSGGEEFKEALAGNKADTGSNKLEKKILELDDSGLFGRGLAPKERKRLEEMEDSWRRKAFALLWAYLARLNLDDPALEEEKYEVAPIALQLIEALVNIALAYGDIMPALFAFRSAQNLIQAMTPNGSPLLQLPYFTSDVVEAVEGEHARKHMTVQDFMVLPDEKRRQTALQAGLTSEQYQTVINTASQFPNLKIEKMFFKVTGERFVTQGSEVTFVVKARFVPLGAKNIPEVNELDLEDVDPEEGDLDALHGRKKKVKTVDGVKTIDISEEKPQQPPLAHAPYFARDHSPKWHLFLGDSKSGKIAFGPYTFSTFENPIVDADGNPTYNMQTLKIKFPAQMGPGRYTLVMYLICDSYVGLDSMGHVTLVVEEPSKAEEYEEEEEPSEPEEDSIAGAMNTIRTGGAPPAKTPKKARKPVEESSDDESDTEGDEESESETDTDTDTDEE